MRRRPGTTTSHSAATRLAGSTILLVEDDGDTASLLKLVLEDAAATVLIAATTGEATGWLTAVLADPGDGGDAPAASPPVDLILLDLLLRDGDSAAALVQLQRGGYVLPPMVIVSAASRPIVEAAAIELGAAGVVYKPFELRRLLLCIEEALRPRT